MALRGAGLLLRRGAGPSVAGMAARAASTGAMEGAQHLAPAIGRMVNDAAITHGAGSWLHFSDGRRMLDFACGIAVTNTGHCHPRVVKAIQEQAGRVLHAQMNVGASAPALALINSLQEILPMDGPSIMFANSGAEAVENAVKLARLHTGRQNVVVLQHSFHGRTAAALSMTTSKAAFRQGVGPLMSGVYSVPAPYCLHCTSTRTQDGCCSRPLDELRLLLKSQSPAADTAAIVVEPVLGEGGYVVPPPAYLRELRKVCDEHGILLVADEVQSGFGRTGKFFAVEHFLNRDEAPDIMLLAKGIASGMPLSAVACNREVMVSAPKSSIGGTYGGNPVSCAAAVATIEVIKEEGLLENSQARGKQLRGRLEAMQAQRPNVISEVRGLGLMNAVEFKAPGGGVAAKVSELAVKEGLLLMPTGAFDTMRFMPPLTVSEEEVDQALDIFEKCLDNAVAK